MTFFLSPDSKDATQNILEVYQGGIMLEDKEYYLDTDATMADIREAYQQHIIEMMQLFGFTEEQATQKMTNILRIETELAKVSRSGTELRDPEANYNKMTLAHFESQYPHIHLEKLMNAVGIQSVCMPELVVGQPEFFTGADKLIASMTVDEYRDYLEWINIKLAAGYLDDKTRATYYEFFGKVMSGRQEDYPLWERVMDQMNEQMGDALGKIYVDKYFPPAAKERVLQLVKNLQTAFSEHIEKQDWLSDATKAVCKDKLNAFIVMMGYPDKWIDMSALTIDPQKSYYENIVSCIRFRGAYDIEHKAGKPVDRSEWEMSPQTVNAYYNPFSNAICFPAGILQPPFFDMEADDAYNYGSIGAVIGHEMSHGFDDQGRHYDKEGNLTNWWTPEDEARFNEKASVLADFFDQIEVLPGLHANGRMTLGENLADLCGLKVAWSAYKKATKNNPLPTIDGLTADQRFFLAYAYSYAENITDARIRQYTIGNVHSVERWRVNGIVPHFDAWYDAFDVKEGDKMYIPKASRVDLW
jgi:putative endopeptidase